MQAVGDAAPRRRFERIALRRCVTEYDRNPARGGFAGILATLRTSDESVCNGVTFED